MSKQLGYKIDFYGKEDVASALQVLIQKNFAKADVYLQTLSVESIVQEPKYTVRTLYLFGTNLS